MRNQGKFVLIRTIMVVLLLVPDARATNKPTDKAHHLGVSFNDAMNREAACPPVCPRDCKDIQDLGYFTSNVYVVYLVMDADRPITVYCDMDTSGGGWLLFQQRLNGMTDFNRNWTEYESGFGQLLGEFWLGNLDLSLLLEDAKNYRLRVDLTNMAGGSALAEYTVFTIGPAATEYRLHFQCGSYNGTAGDSLSNSNNMKYTTYDNDNDLEPWNCATMFASGAWWHNACYYANLNGIYNHTEFYWYTWIASPLKTTEMKFRPM